MINGAPLGENPLVTYLPHSSFNEHGYLKQDIIENLKRKAFVPITEVQPSGFTLETSTKLLVS